MVDNPDPPRPQRKPSGNSAAALRALLERHGLHELLAEVDRHRGLTLFGACCEAGLRKRPEPLGSGSPNMARTRTFYFNKALREGARANGGGEVMAGDNHDDPDRRRRHRGAPATARAPRGIATNLLLSPLAKHSSSMPDLAAALGEVAEMHSARAHPVARIQRQARREETSAPIGTLEKHRAVDAAAERDRLIHVIERLEDRLQQAPFAHPSLPCTTCSSSCATAAMKEIVDTYLAARRGEQDLAGSVTPRGCCKRRLVQRPDVQAMIA
jgi:hypothetical protein